MTKINIFPSHQEKLITAVLIAFALGILIGILAQPNDNISQTLLIALATLFAAFLGAWVAFRFQNIREQEREIKRNIAAGNKAIFLLSRQYNELTTYNSQVIDPVRKDKWNILNLQPTLALEHGHLSFEVSELSYLLETKHRNILGELLVGETRFKRTIDAINERSHLMLNEVQPLLEKGGIVLGGNYTAEDIKNAIGERLFVILEKSTAQVISNVEQDMKDIIQMNIKLHHALKDIFPESDIIKIE